METDRRSRHYVFRPNPVTGLERRDVPSVGAMPAELRNLSATIVGSTHPVAMNDSGPGDRQIAFSGTGKDRAGRKLSLSGSLITYDPSSYAYRAGTFGSAKLVTKRGVYQFNLEGPASDLNADSGVSNVTFWVSKARPAPNQVGAARAPLVVAKGSLQVHREPGPNGGEFTGSIVLASPLFPMTVASTSTVSCGCTR